MSLYQLPQELPVPVDDGACAHLEGTTVPVLELESTLGPLDLASFGAERAVLYVYPRTGQPRREVPAEWDAIPGARGCTPQSCGFRDHREELQRLGVRLAGLSAQTLEEQIELSDAHDYTFSAARRALRYAPAWAIKLAMLPSMAALSTASSASERTSWGSFRTRSPRSDARRP